ncbi:hypothetical protein ACOZ2V_005481 [Pseudomonas aeruginosa]
MSSTQHQLIEQCATRLRGIVEALDNIHDNTPHRWSTDLDDVHSSAESLLALIKDQAPTQAAQGLASAALAQPSPKCATCNDSGQIVVSGPHYQGEFQPPEYETEPCDMCAQPSPAQAEQHWPKLEKPAKVGGVRFSAGVSSRLVVEAAQRLYEFESTPEKEAERIERLQAFREQLDPLNLAQHAEAFNEAPADALRPEQAEAERPEVVAYFDRNYPSTGDAFIWSNYEGSPYEPVMTVAQHARIVGELRADAQRWREQFDCMQLQRNHHRDRANAALARVAELVAALERIAKVPSDSINFHPSHMRRVATEALAGMAPPAQAQHSVPDGAADLCRFLAKLYCELDGLRYSTAKLPAEQIADALIFKWPVLQGARNQLNIKRISEQPYDESKLHSAIAAMLAAAPGKEVPQAWLDVQAERRRQVEAEGWTPEHDDQHSHGQMARAAACYALAGSSAPSDGTAALLVSLAWPWDEQWWKPSTARRDLVKACALALAEIERLDRAGISQSPQPGATTASS